MKNTYTNEISELQKWVEQTNRNLATGFLFLHTEAEIQTVSQRLYDISVHISDEYPFYASELPVIAQTLVFWQSPKRIQVAPGSFWRPVHRHKTACF